MLLLGKFSTCLKSILKILEITPDNDLVLKSLHAIMKLAPIGVLWSLGSHYIIGRERSFSVSLIQIFDNSFHYF